ncbi:MAG TPA: phosphoribosylanthranilate isomerase [Magnetococcales bacterium]|nr:phosphoribosylanthranilate isomerase [Magnetococcales bacterium]
MSCVRIKICGITRRDDALAAIDAGADAIGLVFYDKSPRAITVAQAADLVRGLPPFVTLTGLFVNASIDEIKATVAQVGLDAIQLHGDETPDFCKALSCRTIKALRVAEFADVTAAEQYDVAAILYDTKVSGLSGGSGRTFDWSLLEHHPGHCPLILAGGLNPGNAAKAIAKVRPYAVDVSSGVELSPGVKDPGLIKRFVREVHRATRWLRTSATNAHAS